MRDKKFAHISDQQLIQYYHNDGNTEWLGILLQRYTLLLFGVCMKYLKDPEEAKDSVQQIFVKVLEELKKYKVEYFKSWLYMVAKNHCLMKLRNGNQKKNVEWQDYSITDEQSPNKETLQKEDKNYDYLEEGIQQLNEAQQQCINLFYLQKKSYQEVADITGFSLLQVKSHIQNGKRNLKIWIERKQQEEKTK